MTWRCAEWRRPYKHLFPLAPPSVGLCTDWKTSCWWLDMFNAANITISEFLQLKKKSSTDDVWRLTSIRGEHHKEGTWLPSLLSKLMLKSWSHANTRCVHKGDCENDSWGNMFEVQNPTLIANTVAPLPWSAFGNVSIVSEVFRSKRGQTLQPVDHLLASARQKAASGIIRCIALAYRNTTR